MSFDPRDLSQTDIRFALFRYHLLFSPERSHAVLHAKTHGDDWAALLVTKNQTDPSAPLVIAHGTRAAARQLFTEALSLGKRYLFILPQELRPMLLAQSYAPEYGSECLLYSCQEVERPEGELHPVQRFQDRHGCFGYRVHSGGKVVSEARVNWRTEQFAEIGIHTKRDFRGRGYAKSTLLSLTEEIQRHKLRPLYVVEQQNPASIAVCQAIGYLPSGQVEYESVARYSRGAHRLIDQ